MGKRINVRRELKKTVADCEKYRRLARKAAMAGKDEDVSAFQIKQRECEERVARLQAARKNIDTE